MAKTWKEMTHEERLAHSRKWDTNWHKQFEPEQGMLTLGGAPSSPAPARDIKRSGAQPAAAKPSMFSIDDITASVKPLENSYLYEQQFGDDRVKGEQANYGSPTTSYKYNEVQQAAQQIKASGEPLQQGNKFYDTGNPEVNEALYGADIANNLPGDGTSGFRTPRQFDVGVGDYIASGLKAGVLGAATGAILGPALGALGGKVASVGGTSSNLATGTLGTLGKTTNALGGLISGAGAAVGPVAGQDELGFAAASGTPYGAGPAGILAAGRAPDDFADADFGDMSSIIDNTRMVVQIPGLPPLPTYGMKIEDLKNLPGETWDYVKGIADGSVSVSDVAQKIVDTVGGTLDGAMQSASTILAGAQGAYDAWKNDGNMIVNAAPEEEPISSPVTGADTGADTVNDGLGVPPGSDAEFSSGQILGQPLDEVAMSETQTNPDAVFGWDNPLIDPRTGEAYVDHTATGPNEFSRGELINPDSQVVSSEPLVTGSGSGGSGGNGSGPGEFDDFMATVNFDFPLQDLVDISNEDYLAGLFGDEI